MSTDAPERIWAQATACNNWDEPIATPHYVEHFIEYIRKDVADAAVKAENEACAKVADDWKYSADAEIIAEEIRARTEKPE